MKSPLNLTRSALYRMGHLYRHIRGRETWRRFRIAAARYDTSVPRIVVRALRLYWVGRFLPEESLSKGLVDPSVPFGEHERHFSEERLHGFQNAINSPHAAMCRDKLLFHAYCGGHNLPVAPMLGIVSTCGSRRHDGRPLNNEAQWCEFIETALPPAFIIKPRWGNQGRGVRLIGTGAGRDPEAVRALSREFMALAGGGEDYVMEERLVVHDDIARLTGTDAISSIRVVTLVPDSGVPEIMGAYARLIVGDSITDNISDFATGKYSGNLLANIDLESGRIATAWLPSTDGVGYHWTEEHPRTSRSLIGERFPCWEEIRRLVQGAAERFLPIRTVGWDVAVTPGGAVLIEANEQYKYSDSGESVSRLRNALSGKERRRGDKPAADRSHAAGQEGGGPC